MARWYCKLKSEVLGPLTSGELLQKVKQGQVTEQTLVRKDDSKWTPANTVNGLFESALASKSPSKKHGGLDSV